MDEAGEFDDAERDALWEIATAHERAAVVEWLQAKHATAVRLSRLNEALCLRRAVEGLERGEHVGRR